MRAGKGRDESGNAAKIDFGIFPIGFVRPTAENTGKIVTERQVVVAQLLNFFPFRQTIFLQNPVNRINQRRPGFGERVVPVEDYDFQLVRMQFRIPHFPCFPLKC